MHLPLLRTSSQAAIIAFAVTAVISVAGIIVYKKICDKHEKKAAAERKAADEEISKKNGE